MKFRVLFALFIAYLMIACGTGNTRMTGSWKNSEILQNRSYNTVFIAVINPNVQLRNTLENELALRANNKGVKAVKSHDIFKQKFTSESVPSKEELLEAIKMTNADVIFTVTLKDKETSSRYVAGNTTYYTPLRYRHYRNFYGYYSDFYPVAYDPGYYTEDKTYYMESNLYDVATENLIWSAQSATTNPNDFEDFTQGYTEALINQLLRDGIIKKTT